MIGLKEKNSPLCVPRPSLSFHPRQGIHFTEAARSALPGGRPQRPSEALRRGRRLLTLSTSLHSCAEVEAEAEAAAAAAAAATDPTLAPSSCSSSYDYVFLSPLFESISKPGYGGEGPRGASAKFWGSSGGDGDGQGSSSAPSPALAAALRSARESSSPRRRSLGVVALGGIGPSRLRLVSGLGFEAAAVLGAVWGSDDPVEAWEEIVEEAAAVSAAAAAAPSS